MGAPILTSKTQQLDCGSDPLSPELPSRFLVCLNGPEIARSVALDRAEVVLGSTPSCELMVQAVGVSRRHCVVRYDGDQATLEDLGSTNGTLVNEQRLRARTPHALRSGDLIRLGEAALKYLERGDVEARYHEAVFRLMGVDALTQLKNRRFLLDQLDREIARSGRHERTLSIVLVDLDHFKGINDSHGHLAGDAVLQQIGVTLGRATRREDCVGRLGGDEFLVLLPETQPHGARLFAARLCANVAGSAYCYEGRRLDVSISAGVATWERGIDSAHALLDAADRALYAAKRAGRSQAGSSEP
jgi:diguanylate cyclase (GGDEF)-like protein